MKDCFKKLLVLMVLLVSIVAFVGCKYESFEEISVEVEYDNQRIYYKENIKSEEKVVFKLLEKLCLEDEDFTFEAKDSEYGKYIISICGISEKTENSKLYYWSFYVNGNYASKGISSQKLSNGMSIKFVYESFNLN